MEKLSSILPSNSRITSVDLEDGPPVRPGAPAFGRKMGQNTIKDKVTLSNQAKEMALKDTLIGRKDPKEVARTKMVEEISRKFFETRLQKPVIEETRIDAPTQENIVDDQIEALDMSPIREQISQYDSSSEAVAPKIDIEA